MKILNLVQGSPEWKAARLKHFTASEAPAMMGESPYMTRTQLMHMKATGIEQDIDDHQQRRFDAGHEAEAAARPIVEAQHGTDFYPVTGSLEVEGLPLLASFDGLTMDYSVGFEHKLMNAELATVTHQDDISPLYYWQLEQQLLISGADRILFVASDGTAENMIIVEYRSVPERRAQLIAAWHQFAKDLAAYVPEEVTPAAVGRAPDSLPSLLIQVTGAVTASNLSEFKTAALEVLHTINTDLQTDQDFADAEKAVKFCKQAEDSIEQAKAHALSQTASIDELFRTMDDIKEEARAVRLRLEKLVKAEKENRRNEIVTGAQINLMQHIHNMNERLGGNYMPRPAVNFGEVIKGLKSLDSMRDKIGTALAHAKVEQNAIADLIEANLKAAEGLMFLFPDFTAVCTKASDDFAAILAMRKQQRDDRVESEAKAKAKAEAQTISEAEQKPEQTAPVVQVVAPALENTAAAVIERQDDISAFIQSRDFGKDSNRIRAVLVEFVKFTAERGQFKAAA